MRSRGRTLLYVLGLVLLTGGLWWYGQQTAPPPPAPSVARSTPAEGEIVLPAPEPGTAPNSTAPSASPASANAPAARMAPAGSAPAGTTSAGGGTAAGAAADSGRERIELDKVSRMLRDYRTLMGENPVGTNAEIMKSIVGGNPRHATIGPPEGQTLNAQGELVDSWGTPYFFHQLSGQEMEVHSAGPDRILGTGDDLVWR